MSEQMQSSGATSPDALGELLSKILGSQIPADAEQGAQATQKGDTPSQGGDILSSLLSNSDLILKLPSIISAAKPIIELFSQGQRPNTEQTTPKNDVVAANAQPVSAISAKQPHGTDHRTALLCAMKPYLGNERRQIIDYIVKLSRLGDILKTL